ncbi:MAG: DUF1553 domain-containing protein [Verrucomicrobiota bacterium]
MSVARYIRTTFFSVALLLNISLRAADPIRVSANSAEITFQKTILPILEKHCVECHGGETQKADLDLRTLQAILRGGESGEALVVPGDAAHSLLFKQTKSQEMPPKKRTKLNNDELTLIEKWINSGASMRKGLADVPVASLSPELKNARKAYDVLELKCFLCHNDKKKEGELDLRTVASMTKGGKTGAALVKGDAGKSLLVKQIHDDAMPPRDLRNKVSIKPVTEAELDSIKQWINAGAIEPPPLPGIAEEDLALVSEADRQWWAFQTPRQVPIPKVKGKTRTAIDAFLLAKLEEKSLGFSPEADRRTLARRVYLYVTGLPPTPEQMDLFLNDKKSGAYERLIDQLLASPRYGERWARFWLDAAGYADSEGALSDDPIWEEFWRYRDYVIRSLNADKPYDQFLMEQLAGDELVDYRNATNFTPEIADKLIATGFLRGGIDPTMSPETSFLPERYQVLADKMETVGSSLMGLTLQCARCHSHKYDPISQRDYYRMESIFAAAFTPRDWRKPTERYIPLATAAEQKEADEHNKKVDAEKKIVEQPLDEWKKTFKAKLLEQKIAKLAEKVREQLREVALIPNEKRTDPQKLFAAEYVEQLKAEDAELNSKFPEYKPKFEELTAAVAKVEAKRRKLDRAFGLTDLGADTMPFHLLRRGEPFERGNEVRPNIPAVLIDSKMPFAVKPPWTNAPTTGRRLAFARWLTHPENPLTARVIVNRTWQNYFGKGIVETVENFGHTGAKPTHPELLDWLSVEFVKQGWSLKKLHRLILTSTAFRQESHAAQRNGDGDVAQVSNLPYRSASSLRVSEKSGRVKNFDAQPVGNRRYSRLETCATTDPENELLWHMPLRRLDGEAIRDSILAGNGLLRTEMFGTPSPIDMKADGQIVTKNAPENFRRSIYMLQQRSKPLTMLEAFDAPQLSVNCTRRRLSNVVSQPLLMFNSEFMAEQATHLSERIAKSATKSTEQINFSYELLLNRPPTKKEREMALRFLEQQSSLYERVREEESKPVQQDALIDFCLVLLNSAEFIYVD